MLGLGSFAAHATAEERMDGGSGGAMGEMPVEVLAAICVCVEPVDVLAWACTCRAANALLSHDYVWAGIYQARGEPLPLYTNSLKAHYVLQHCTSIYRESHMRKYGTLPKPGYEDELRRAWNKAKGDVADFGEGVGRATGMALGISAGFVLGAVCLWFTSFTAWELAGFALVGCGIAGKVTGGFFGKVAGVGVYMVVRGTAVTVTFAAAAVSSGAKRARIRGVAAKARARDLLISAARTLSGVDGPIAAAPPQALESAPLDQSLLSRSLFGAHYVLSEDKEVFNLFCPPVFVLTLPDDCQGEAAYNRLCLFIFNRSNQLLGVLSGESWGSSALGSVHHQEAAVGGQEMLCFTPHGNAFLDKIGSLVVAVLERPGENQGDSRAGRGVRGVVEVLPCDRENVVQLEGSAIEEIEMDGEGEEMDGEGEEMSDFSQPAVGISEKRSAEQGVVRILNESVGAVHEHLFEPVMIALDEHEVGRCNAYVVATIRRVKADGGEGSGDKDKEGQESGTSSAQAAATANEVQTGQNPDGVGVAEWQCVLERKPVLASGVSDLLKHALMGIESFSAIPTQARISFTVLEEHCNVGAKERGNTFGGMTVSSSPDLGVQLVGLDRLGYRCLIGEDMPLRSIDLERPFDACPHLIDLFVLLVDRNAIGCRVRYNLASGVPPSACTEGVVEQELCEPQILYTSPAQVVMNGYVACCISRRRGKGLYSRRREDGVSLLQPLGVVFDGQQTPLEFVSGMFAGKLPSAVAVELVALRATSDALPVKAASALVVAVAMSMVDEDGREVARSKHCTSKKRRLGGPVIPLGDRFLFGLDEDWRESRLVFSLSSVSMLCIQKSLGEAVFSFESDRLPLHESIPLMDATGALLPFELELRLSLLL